MQTLLVVLAALVAMYAALVVIAWRFGEVLMFPAPGPSYRRGSLEGLLTLRAADGNELSALHLGNPRACYTILYSHGNGEDLGNILPVLERIHDLGFAVFAYDYRGYGASPGRPSADGVVLDAQAAYTHVTDVIGVPPHRLILWGRSIGGGPTVQLASEHACAGLVLEATFTSAFCVVTSRRILPFDRFENRRLIRGMRLPTLFIHGTKDRIVPFVHGRRNFECAAEPKTAAWVDGAGHNDLWLIAPDRIGDALVAFAESLGADGAREVPSRAAS
jgi:fermentation-respiration switch protein FrsA (DUF1100 family)